MSGRVVVTTWWMFVVLVVGCYTANLAAFLTVTNIGTTINTVEELMAQSQVQYGLIKDSGVHQLLKVTTTSSIIFVQLTVILIAILVWCSAAWPQTKYGVTNSPE